MRVNFIGSSHIYYHKSNYLSLTTILTHRDIVNVNCTSDLTLINDYKNICSVVVDSKAQFIKFFIRIILVKRICHCP